MSDYTLVSKSIIRTLEKAGSPLSEDQEILLSGAIAGHLIVVQRIGLEAVLQNLAEREARKH